MKIGMVLDKIFPPDIRVENEATSLAENGFEVYLLCLDYNNTLPGEEVYNGFNIIRLRVSKKWIFRGRALINTPFNFYTYYWAEKIKNFIDTYKINILHVHDLYLLGAAFLANRKYKIPIVADLHENYVEGLKNYQFANTFPGNILISKSRWAKKEVEWCHRADFIITVIEEAVERYSSLGVPRDKIAVVANYVNQDQFLNAKDDPEIVNRFKDYFSAIYIGGFDAHRGLESVINAVPEIVKKIPHFKLILVGQGRNYNNLVRLSEKYKIKDYISFEGFQLPDKLPSYIKASTICLIPHLKTVHTDNTIPHKLFQYMLLGKPVISSDCNPIVRIVREAEAGLIYKSGNQTELAEQIVYLAKNKTKIKQMGDMGQLAVKNNYNWGNAAKNLIGLYSKFEKTVT